MEVAIFLVLYTGGLAGLVIWAVKAARKRTRRDRAAAAVLREQEFERRRSQPLEDRVAALEAKVDQLEAQLVATTGTASAAVGIAMFNTTTR
jgi:hypothetical protein